MSTRACGFVIFRQICGQIEYLLLQTSYGQHHWTPPKGHVETGESDMKTALRETREEAGFLKEDLKIFESAKQEITYTVNDKPKTVVYWLAEMVNKTKAVTLSNEHQNFKWLTLQDACNLAAYTEMQCILKHFDKYISENVL